MLQWILKAHSLDANHTCLRYSKGRKGMHVEKLVFVGPTGLGLGIMYRGCHIVSLPHVFTQATSFKCPTCETAGKNQFI